MEKQLIFHILLVQIAFVAQGFAESSRVRGWAFPDLGNDGVLESVDIDSTTEGELENAVVVVETAGLSQKSTEPESRPSTSGATEVELNPGKDRVQAAAINAFRLVTMAHDFYLRRLGIDILMEAPPLRVVVNASTLKCNAEYEAGILTFSKEDSKCLNAVEPVAVFHEYTHYVDSLIDGISDAAFAEGLADMAAAFFLNKPEIMDLYKKNNVLIRSADNKVQFDVRKINSEKASVYYNQAMAWSGFAWHSRQGFIAKYGYDLGSAKAEMLFFSPLIYNDKSILEGVERVFSQVDPKAPGGADDYQILREAALRHGFNVESFNVDKEVH